MDDCRDKILRIVLDDYACPSFCSFTALYFGTEDDIDAFAEHYRERRLERAESERCRIEDSLCRLYEMERSVRFGHKTQEDIIEERSKGERISREALARSIGILFSDESHLDSEAVANRYARYAESLSAQLYALGNDAGFYDGAWREYKEGQENAQVNAAMCRWKFVDECETYGGLRFGWDNGEQTVFNIYMYPTELRWEKALFDIRWVKTLCEHGGRRDDTGQGGLPLYARIMKIDFRSIQSCSEFSGKWGFPGSWTWGIPGILACEVSEYDGKQRAVNGNISTRLWLMDRTFDNEQSLKEDMASCISANKADVDLSVFYHEISGDG